MLNDAFVYTKNYFSKAKNTPETRSQNGSHSIIVTNWDDIFALFSTNLLVEKILQKVVRVSTQMEIDFYFIGKCKLMCVCTVSKLLCILSKLLDIPSYLFYFVFQANMSFFSQKPRLFNTKEDYCWKATYSPWDWKHVRWWAKKTHYI